MTVLQKDILTLSNNVSQQHDNGGYETMKLTTDQTGNSLKKRTQKNTNDKISSISTKKSGKETIIDNRHLPVTEIHLRSHEWFSNFVTKYEIPRKFLHSSIGFITLYLYTQNINYKHVPFPLEVAFVIIFAIDLIRLNWFRFNELYCHTVGALMRKKEIHTYNGVLWYLLGLSFSFTFFSKDIALLSVFLLSWCDTAASTFGRIFGHLTPKVTKNKSLAGSAAAFIVGVIITYVLYGYFIPQYPHVNRPGEIEWSVETSHLSLFRLSLAVGFIGSLSEGIDLFNWDDNFTIPVLSAIFLKIVFITCQK